MNCILCASDQKDPVLVVLLSLASEADPRLGRLLYLQNVQYESGYFKATFLYDVCMDFPFSFLCAAA